MLVSHATVAQNRLSQFTAYNGFMLTALWYASQGATVYANMAFRAADRYL